MMDHKKYLEAKGRDIRKSEITDTLTSNPEEEALKKHVQDQLKSFKQTLNPKQSRILDMYLSGFSHQEIAEEFNFTKGSSKWHVNDILNRFRKFYQKLYRQLKRNNSFALRNAGCILHLLMYVCLPQTLFGCEFQ